MTYGKKGKAAGKNQKGGGVRLQKRIAMKGIKKSGKNK